MCRVHIPMMQRTTGRAAPFSYPQRPQSTRPGPLQAGRASDAGEHLTAWDADTSKPDGFVVQLMSGDAPGSIIGRFGKWGLGQLRAGGIADNEQSCATANGGCDFVRPVSPDIGNFGMECLDPLRFACTLGKRQCVFIGTCEILATVDAPVRAGDLMDKPKINANLGLPHGLCTVDNLALQIDIPPAPSVLGETARFDRAPNGTGQPQPEAMPTVCDDIAGEADIGGLEGNPAQRAFLRGCPKTNVS